MDFAAVPCRSVMDRLGHLLSIDSLVRLKLVQPRLAASCPRARGYSEVHMRVEEEGGVNVVFVNPEEPAFPPMRVQNYDAHALLNDGPLKCGRLYLSCVHGVPSAAIECQVLICEPSTDPYFPFTTTAAGKTSDTNGFSNLLLHLGPSLTELGLTVLPGADGPDLSVLRFRRPRRSLEMLLINMPTVQCSLSWLTKNVAFLATGKFCATVWVRLSDSQPCPAASASGISFATPLLSSIGHCQTNDASKNYLLCRCQQMDFCFDK